MVRINKSMFAALIIFVHATRQSKGHTTSLDTGTSWFMANNSEVNTLNSPFVVIQEGLVLNLMLLVLY